MQGRTSFIVAHRLSTIRERRRHPGDEGRRHHRAGHSRELLAKGGFYAELYNSQFAG